MASKSHPKNRFDGAFIKSRFNRLNHVIGRFETEFEGLFKKLVKQGEKSSKDLRQNFDTLLTTLKKSNFYHAAKKKSIDVEKELFRFSEEVISKVKRFELKSGNFSGKKLLKDARKNLDLFVNKLENSSVVSLAKNRAENTRDGILSLLSIPSQSEVVKLERKISTLEKKIHTLSSKAA